LVEWFIAQNGKPTKGFSKAIYSGFTTLAFSEIVRNVVEKAVQPGLYHVSSEPITKYSLLVLLKKAFCLDIEIAKEETFCCDRSLNSDRFRKLTGFVPPTWDDMVSQMLSDASKYEEWRSRC
jgi:dTDP-4-dehydrorhamnose reductase